MYTVKARGVSVCDRFRITHLLPYGKPEDSIYAFTVDNPCCWWREDDCCRPERASNGLFELVQVNDRAMIEIHRPRSYWRDTTTSGQQWRYHSQYCPCVLIFKAGGIEFYRCDLRHQWRRCRVQWNHCCRHRRWHDEAHSQSSSSQSYVSTLLKELILLWPDGVVPHLFLGLSRAWRKTRCSES